MSSRGALAAVLVAIVIAGGSSAAVVTAEDPTPEPVAASTVWEERPESIEDMAALSTAVVEAEVVEIERGPDLYPQEHDDADYAIPTERVELRVLEEIAGSAPTTLTLFKTGSSSVYPEYDPAYAVGEQYVLFVRPREADDGTWLVVAPDGRMKERPSGELRVLAPGEVRHEAADEGRDGVEAEAQEVGQ